MSDKILLVDDDVNLLGGLRRQLHLRYAATTAVGGILGLEAIRTQGPFAVVVSDMRMPEKSGIEFLREVSEISPDTVRVMLTGNADLQTAIDAVNEGHIFRFLSKPCLPAVLASTLDAALAQYHLVTAERQLLSQTLTSSVKVLTDVLALANPVAFGRANRIRKLMRRIVERMKPPNAWECEIAAMLSQVGYVAISPAILAKADGGGKISPAEAALLEAHPKTAHDLIVGIPRLAGVAKIVLYQNRHYLGGGFPADGVVQDAIPLGARILSVCLDYDALVAQGCGVDQARDELAARGGRYDPDVLDVLTSILEAEPRPKDLSVDVVHLPIGAILADNIVSSDGAVLVSKGQEVTESMRLRLLAHRQTRSVREPIRILLPGAPEPAAAK